jgi:hypothetical protein
VPHHRREGGIVNIISDFEWRIRRRRLVRIHDYPPPPKFRIANPPRRAGSNKSWDRGMLNAQGWGCTHAAAHVPPHAFTHLGD